MRTTDTQQRVKPSLGVGLAIFFGYAAVFFAAALVVGVDYDEIADTTENIIKAIVVPVWIGVAVLLALTAYLGWWRSVFRDEHRSPRWTLLIPAFMAIGIVGGLVTADWGDFEASFLVWLLVGTIAVGIAEEVLTRGLLLVGLRSRVSEAAAWFWSSLLFGLWHGLNLLAGQALGATIRQVLFAFVFGSILYASRRATGTPVVPIALHALWDFTTFLGSGSDADVGAATTANPETGLQSLAFLAVIVFLFAARSLFRSAHSGTETPAAT